MTKRENGNQEIPEDVKELLKFGNMSEEEFKSIIVDCNIKFYWKKDDIMKEFCEWLICSNIEKKYSYLEKHYLSVKDEHRNTNFNSMVFKYIYNQISPKLDLEINNNQIEMWIKDIKKFWEKDLKGFCMTLTLVSDEDFWEITDKFFIDNYINKDWLPVIHAWFYLAYREMFAEINEEFIKFLENKIEDSKK